MDTTVIIKARSMYCSAVQLLHLALLLTLSLQVQTQECPEVFGDYGDSFYCLYNMGETFEDARSYCQSLGGDLPIIPTPEQNDFLSAGVMENGITNEDYWIGLEWSNQSMFLFWIDGNPPNYQNWQKQLTLMPGNCGFMFGSNSGSPGKWQISPCGDSKPSICQFRNALPLGSWAPLGDRLYYVSADLTARTYQGARGYCQKLGGDLAQPRTDAINKLLSRDITLITVTEMWIGIRYDTTANAFLWVDGTSLGNSFMPWMNGSTPMSGSSASCVYLYDNKWDISSCDAMRTFACEVSGALPAGSWISFGNNNYFLSPSWLLLSFHDARNYCQDLGGDVAQPKNDESYNFLKERFDGRIWLGLSDEQSEGTYVWIDGTSLDASFLQRITMDSQNEGNDCVTMQNDGTLDVQPCTNRFRYMCQRSRGPDTCPEEEEDSAGNCLTCNCLDGRPCNNDTGACLESNGECAVGYISDSEGSFDNCRQFSGCYDSCLSTCHCSGGAIDCNSVTGTCFSKKCTLRWAGEKCQTDRFTIEVEKTNPGVASFNCSFSTEGLGDQLIGGINIARNGTVINSQAITAYDTTMGIISRSFLIVSISSDEIIYCTLGYDLSSTRPFVYVRIPEREFYVLPQLNSTLMIEDVGAEQVTLFWREWNPDLDVGDEPVISYTIYTRKMVDGAVLQNETIPVTESSSRSRREPTVQMISHNVTDLEPETQYFFSISVVREGIGGEGPEGEAINVTTAMHSVAPVVQQSTQGAEPSTPTPTPPKTPTISYVSATTTSTQARNAVAMVAGIAGGVAAFLIILLILIILIFILKRRRKNKNAGEEHTTLQLSPASIGGNDPEDISSDDLDGEDKSVPDSVSPETVLLQSNKPDSSPSERSSVSSHVRPVAEVSPMTKRQPIPVADFPSFMLKNRHTSFFSDEFEALPMGNQFPQSVARLPANFDKNRYKNILPYDLTRVVLNTVDDDPTSDYYNASYISKCSKERVYIACQGPNKASIDDFWRMVWQEKVQAIAMVTKLKEGDTLKCRQYWPNVTNQMVPFGHVHVRLESSENCAGWVVRHLVLHHGAESRSLRQFHYRKWPDKGVPRYTSSLLKFLRAVQTNRGQTEAPLLVHCSAGVGRSGVVIAIDGVLAEAKATGFIDVFNFVSSMRQNRPHMVQTEEQYEFLHEAILIGLLWKDTSIPVANFSSHLSYLQEKDPDDQQTRLAREFENLQVTSPASHESMYRSGRMPANEDKNRYKDLLPLQRNRVMLRTHDGEEDYINASFVKGARYTYITTAMPMENTVSEFWAMIYDYNPSCIIMLNDENEDESCEKYWPEEGSVSYDSFTVSTSSTSRENDIIVRSLRVQHADSSTYHDVDQFQFLGWSRDTLYQGGGASSLLALIDRVQESADTEGYVLVHCLNGVGRTGVFCTAMECIAEISEGDTVDIFQTVKMLRVDRTHFVQTEEDYAYLYTVLQEYLRRKNYEQVTVDPALRNEKVYSKTNHVDPSTEPEYGNTGRRTDNINMVGGQDENTTENHPQPTPQQMPYENVMIGDV